jgi:hypothetical protein
VLEYGSRLTAASKLGSGWAVNFLTSYYDNHGVRESRPGYIANRYLHGWFLIDFLSYECLLFKNAHSRNSFSVGNCYEFRFTGIMC